MKKHPVSKAYPWLEGKWQQLKALLERDAAMASKEMLFGSSKLRNRLASVNESLSVVDETQATHVASYLRRKGSEGTGRSGP